MWSIHTHAHWPLHSTQWNWHAAWHGPHHSHEEGGISRDPSTRWLAQTWVRLAPPTPPRGGGGGLVKLMTTRQFLVGGSRCLLCGMGDTGLNCVWLLARLLWHWPSNKPSLVIHLVEVGHILQKPLLLPDLLQSTPHQRVSWNNGGRLRYTFNSSDLKLWVAIARQNIQVGENSIALPDCN